MFNRSISRYSPYWAIVHNKDISYIDSLLYRLGYPTEELNSLLKVAAENGNLEVLKYLISKNANVQGKWGEIALSYSAQAGEVEVVRYLVEECEVGTAHLEDYDFEVMTRFKHTDLIRYLRSKTNGI